MSNNHLASIHHLGIPMINIGIDCNLDKKQKIQEFPQIVSGKLINSSKKATVKAF